MLLGSRDVVFAGSDLSSLVRLPIQMLDVQNVAIRIANHHALGAPDHEGRPNDIRNEDKESW